MPRKPDASAVLAGILRGVNYPVTKWVLQSIPEGQFLVLRFGAAACIFALLLVLREQKTSRPEIRSPLVLGLLGVGVDNILFTMGIHRTSASAAALIISTSPLITGVWCTLTGREAFTKRRCTGTLIAFAGVILVLAGLLVARQSRSR
jgi:drug/metabolite transporter (DMT)-like permease